MFLPKHVLLSEDNIIALAVPRIESDGGAGDIRSNAVVPSTVAMVIHLENQRKFEISKAGFIANEEFDIRICTSTQ